MRDKEEKRTREKREVGRKGELRDEREVGRNKGRDVKRSWRRQCYWKRWKERVGVGVQRKDG